MQGKVWRIIRNMYSKVQACVQVNDKLSDFFDILVGLKQGCLLSPLLFNIFIDGLIEEIKRVGKGVKCGGITIGCLLFADDIALVAESRADLEVLMEVVWEYSRKWMFHFNLDKSAVVIFERKKKLLPSGDCKESCSCGRHWKFGDGFILEIESYRYLGIEFDKSCTFEEFKLRISDRARRTRALLGAWGSRKGTLSVKANISIWEGIIRAGLEYGAEIWGTGKRKPN